MTDLPGCVVVECPGTEPVIEGLGVHVSRTATRISRDERHSKDRDPPQVTFVTIKTNDDAVFDLKRRMEDDEGKEALSKFNSLNIFPHSCALTARYIKQLATYFFL
jgi:hypothetical protein